MSKQDESETEDINRSSNLLEKQKNPQKFLFKKL